MKKEEMIQWNSDPIMDNWYQQIRFKNEQVESYTKICTAFAPILEKYAKYFKQVSINWGYITLYLKNDCGIPPLYCECDLAGLSAIYKENKFESIYYNLQYNTYEPPSKNESLDRTMEIRLK